MSDRKILPTLADLLDTKSILELKMQAFPQHLKAYEIEHKKIRHDINLILKAHHRVFDNILLQLFNNLLNINDTIWRLKDRMIKDPEHATEYLMKAHEINSLRNEYKNDILDELQDRNVAHRRTNL